MHGFHHHTQNKSRQQHFDMNSPLTSHQRFAEQINTLHDRHQADRIQQNRFPGLRQLHRAQLSPAHNQQHTHHKHNHKQLPLKTNHQNLQRNHQQDGIQIIKNRQHLRFLVNPFLFQTRSRQHRKKNPRRGRRGKPAYQQTFIP